MHTTGAQLDGFILGDRIGSGRKAIIYSATGGGLVTSGITGGNDNMPEYAIKLFRNDYAHAFARELQVLEQVSNKPYGSNNVISAITSLPSHNAIVYPICVPLSKAVRKCIKLIDLVPFNNVMTIMRDILCGLDYLHSCGIVHGDIKRSNILLPHDVDLATNGVTVNALIADLEGCATSADDTISGTTYYLAPELLIEAGHSSAVDIWAAVCMGYELATDCYLFDVYAECNQSYGDDLDDTALEGIVDSTDDSNDCDESNKGNKNNSDHDSKNNHISIDKKNGGKSNKDNITGNDDTNSSDEDHCCGENSNASDEEKCGDDCSVCSSDTEESSDDSSDSVNTDCSDSGDSEDDLDERAIIYRHLLIMEKLLGRPNADFMAMAPDYFTDGLLTGPSDTPNTGLRAKIKMISVRDLIDYNFAYTITQYNRGLLAEFVTFGLDYNPSLRASARELINWIDRAHLV